MNIYTGVRRMLDDEQSRSFHLFTTTLAILTLVSVCATAGETLALFAEYENAFLFIEWLTVGIFTIEYGARIWVAENRKKYVLSWLGFTDLASILPTYLGLGRLEFLKTARIVRTMRFIRFVGRTNVAHVRNKGEELTKEFSLTPLQMVLLVAVLVLLCVTFYHVLFATESESFVHTMLIFLGVVHAPQELGYGRALVLIFGKVLEALFAGFSIGYLVERARFQKGSTQQVK